MKKIGLFVGVIAISAFSLVNCTGDFEEFNKNPYGVTDAEIAEGLVPALLLNAQKNIYVFQPAWVTQLQQNLIGDVYSGYMMPPTPFRGNSNNMTYDLVDGWNTWSFQPAYDNIMNPLSKVESATKDNLPDAYAIAKIIKVEAMHRVSDTFGPIIYTKYKKPSDDGYYDYDTQEEAYDAFFADLDEAIGILNPLVQSNADASGAVVSSDLVYGGELDKWLKFANTLKLRLALRIVYANATKAKSMGESALAHSGGMLASNDDNFIVDIGSATHPLNVINNDWSDIRMGAPMESIMGGYDDPRLSSYFIPATDPAVVGQYKGIRNGINIDAKSRYQDYSKLVTFPNKIQLMVAAEASFLKAEAALRGWAGAGNAKSNYENGISLSFDQHGLDGASAYYADAASTPKEYFDPKSIAANQNDVTNGSPNLSTITIMYDNAASFEANLERIITQKWIAMYPDGQEAWSEFRRTKYPKLFPVIVNNSGGKISGFISRINLVSGEYSTNGPAVERAVAKLGGPDTGGTKLWWDKK